MIKLASPCKIHMVLCFTKLSNILLRCKFKPSATLKAGVVSQVPISRPRGAFAHQTGRARTRTEWRGERGKGGGYENPAVRLLFSGLIDGSTSIYVVMQDSPQAFFTWAVDVSYLFELSVLISPYMNRCWWYGYLASENHRSERMKERKIIKHRKWKRKGRK
jgi:hypothetical protein